MYGRSTIIGVAQLLANIPGSAEERNHKTDHCQGHHTDCKVVWCSACVCDYFCGYRSPLKIDLSVILVSIFSVFREQCIANVFIVLRYQCRTVGTYYLSLHCVTATAVICDQLSKNSHNL